jgi:hypothetical protein
MSKRRRDYANFIAAENDFPANSLLRQEGDNADDGSAGDGLFDIRSPRVAQAETNGPERSRIILGLHRAKQRDDLARCFALGLRNLLVD